jgi:hypothetical protein
MKKLPLLPLRRNIQGLTMQVNNRASTVGPVEPDHDD